MTYERHIVDMLRRRLSEPRRFIQVVAGPRQTGKTTAVRQAIGALDYPARYASADSPSPLDASWIGERWTVARAEAAAGVPQALVLDEVQKVSGWSEQVKALWDEDTAAGAPIHVVLLGSSPLLMRHGLGESLAGRFELIRSTHWTYDECREAFGWDLDTYVYFGGYPGGAALVEEPSRWRAYLTDSLIETTVSRDILLMNQVNKPALLRRLFYLACEYSGRELSFNKMLGQLQDAGNTTTLAHYLELLAGAGLVMGLPKYAGQQVRRRASSPKLLALNTGLISALDTRSPAEARGDGEYWGRLVESAVGATLVARSYAGEYSVHYWRRGDDEVDYVIERGGTAVGIEVKSAPSGSRRGLSAFAEAFPGASTLLVGGDGLALERLLDGSVDPFDAVA